MKPIYLILACGLAVFLFATTLSSCKKNETTTVEAHKDSAKFGNIAYFASASSNPNIKTAAENSNTIASIKTDSVKNTVEINWSSASIWVEKISFTGKNGQLLDTTIMVKKKLNIFNSEALMGIVKLPSGSYKDINVKLFCRKNSSTEYGIDFLGTFTNTKGKKDSLMVRSSIAFEVDVKVNDIVINPSDNYKATFRFDLTKVLTGIANSSIESNVFYGPIDNTRAYVIWKGGSTDVPFYNQIIQNWQSVVSILITKEGNNPDWK